MGWTLAAHPRDKKFQCWIDPLHGNGTRAEHELPDPFTDANDDVAILNFYGDAEDSPERERFLEILYGQQMLDYKIGDYARAALKVMK